MRGDQVLTSFELVEGQQARHAGYFLKNIAGVLHIAPNQTTIVYMRSEFVHVTRSGFNLTCGAILTGNGRQAKIVLS